MKNEVALPATSMSRRQFVATTTLGLTALSASRVLAHYQARTNTTVIVVTPTVSIQPNGADTVTVNWTGTLQESTDLSGTWTDVSNTPPPLTIGTSNSALFFRAITP